MGSVKSISLVALASPLSFADSKCGVGLNPIYGAFDQQLRGSHPIHASWWYNWAPQPNATKPAVKAQFTSTVMDFTWGVGHDVVACVRAGDCSSPWFLSGDFCLDSKINTHPVPQGGYFEADSEYWTGLYSVVKELRKTGLPKVISPSIQPSKTLAAGGVDEVVEIQRKIFKTCHQKRDCPLTHMGVHVSGCTGNEAVEQIKRYTELATELDTRIVVSSLFLGFDEKCLDATAQHVSDFMRSAIAHILANDKVDRLAWMSYDLKQNSDDPQSKGWNNVLKGDLLDTYNKACDSSSVLVV